MTVCIKANLRTRGQSFLHLSRVPCVGEHVWIGDSAIGAPNNTKWLVLSVAHFASEGSGERKVAAEVECIEVRS